MLFFKNDYQKQLALSVLENYKAELNSTKIHNVAVYEIDQLIKKIENASSAISLNVPEKNFLEKAIERFKSAEVQIVEFSSKNVNDELVSLFSLVQS